MVKLLKSERLLKLLKNSATLFIGAKSQGVLLFAQSIIVARTLGVAKFGQWAIVVTFSALIMNFFTLKSGDVVGKFLVQLRQEKNSPLLGVLLRKTVMIDFSLRLIALLIILLLAPLMGKHLNGPVEILPYLLYGAYHFFHFIDSTWFSLERDRSNYKSMAFLVFLRPFLRVICIFLAIFVFHTLDFVVLGWSFLVSAVMVFIVKISRMGALLQQYGSGLMRGFFSPDSVDTGDSTILLEEYKQFMKATYFSTFFSSLIKKMDILAAGYLFTPEVVGYLRLGKNLTKIIQELATNLARPVYQEFNELIAAGKKGKIARFLKKNLPLLLAGLAVILTVISFFIEPFISFVYGTEFLPATLFFQLYLVMVFVTLGSFWANPLILALKGWNYKLKTLIFFFFFLVAAVLAFNVFWGIVGVVTAFILTRFLINLSYSIYIWKVIHVEEEIVA